MSRCRLFVLGLLVIASPATAQDVTVDLDALLTMYADNTEFSNPFREGQTLIGTFAEVFAEARISDSIAMRAGVFAHQRFGSADAFDRVRPVLALIVGGPRSRLVLGTLETTRHLSGAGPDLAGLHGLLPAVQQETLLFERAWESGIQWTYDSARFTQDAWVNWQRINTAEQREIFDAGIDQRFRFRPEMTLRTAAHVVHHGGQLSAIGPVADSWTSSVGLDTGGPVGRLDRVSLEMAAVASRYVPDRGRLAESRTGAGLFVRAAVRHAGWRVHSIVWRSNDFIKLEGDPQYQSLQRDGRQFRSVRDYAEAGVTRTFTLADRSFVEASFRLHRTERDLEYSFRIIAVATLRQRVK